MPERSVTVRIAATDAFSGVVSKFNQQMGTAEQSVKRVGSANRETGGSFDGLGRSITGAVAAIGVMQVVGFGVDMFNLGTQVDVASQNFESLTANIGGSEATLNAMREATHGSLNDLELMGAANNFLALRLASTAEEMATMSQQAIQMGGAVGTGPVQAIETLQRALRNQSFEMLDSLGVSAARVRARVLELKDAGLDMSEAFRRATLEQLDAGVERLGSAADAAFRPTDALLSRLESFQQHAAVNIAQGVDGIALALLNLDKVVVAADDAGILDWLLVGTGGAGFAVGDAARMSLEQQGQAAAAAARNAQGMANAAPWMMRPPSMEDFAALQSAQQSAANSANADSNYGTLESLMNSGMRSQHENEGRFFSQNEADLMRDMSNRADTLVSGLERIAEIQPFDETKLANAQSMADYLGNAADEAERSAQAFEHMTLAQAFGQGGGGRAGELGDMVLSGMDAPADQISALRDAMDLASGRQTELSQTVRDELVPALQQIATNEGPDALADAVQAFNEALDARTMAGESTGDINSWLSGILGGGLGRSSGRGEGEGGIDSEALISALGGGAESMQLMAEQSTILSENIKEAVQPAFEGIHEVMPDVVEGFSGMATKSEMLAGFMTTTHDLISQLVAQVQVIHLDLRVTAPQWAIAAFSGSQAGGAFVAQVIQNAGGVNHLVPDR